MPLLGLAGGMHDDFDLTGEVAIVTGGGSGIGAAVARGLAEAGASVVPAARTEADVEEVAADIREDGGEARGVSADVTDTDDVAALVEATVEEFGGLDILVNNAGTNPRNALGRPEDVEMAGFDATVDVNLRGAFACAQAAAEPLQEGGGSVVNVASVGGLVGLPRQHPYVATKHALVGLTKSMALDWAPDVRVNAVAPGYVRTPFIEEALEREDVRDSLLERTPLDRFAEPAELAGPVIFLASEAARYVTGATIAADGGWTSR